MPSKIPGLDPVLNFLRTSASSGAAAFDSAVTALGEAASTTAEVLRKKTAPAVSLAGQAASTAATTIREKTGSAAASIGGKATTAAASLISVWKKLRRSESRTNEEPPEGLYALCVALAWADGMIGEHERWVLQDLLSKENIDKDLEAWLEQRPTLTQLQPYLAKIVNPQDAAQALAATLGLSTSSPEAKSWIDEIEQMLGITISIN
jgi:uncharacterized membrane protein YebE (DUF533 family)